MSCLIALLGLGLAVSVSAHGHVKNVVIDGVFYQGWDPEAGMGFDGKEYVTVGWPTTVIDNGFISKESYSSGDIVCHRGATNAKAHAQVAAGGIVQLQWNDWPASHHGPVMDYLASCGESCESVDKDSLEFFKISEVGAVKPGAQDSGLWGADILLKNNLAWQVQIPSDISPGMYVLRHEILSLHQGGQPQNYPQCINLEITGGGSSSPKGSKATALYPNYQDFDIYKPFSSYPIPGPAMIAGASPIIQQKSVAASSTAALGAGGGGGGGNGGPAPTGVPKPSPTKGSGSGNGNGNGSGNNGQGNQPGNGIKSPSPGSSGKSTTLPAGGSTQTPTPPAPGPSGNGGGNGNGNSGGGGAGAGSGSGNAPKPTGAPAQPATGPKSKKPCNKGNGQAKGASGGASGHRHHARDLLVEAVA